jgi:hypothetical protein
MDFSIEDVLHGLWAVQAVGCAGLVGYWLHHRTAAENPAPARPRHSHQPAVRHATVRAAEPAPAPRPEPDPLEDTGRHHVPHHLLHSPTYRMSADRVARAKVPD